MELDRAGGAAFWMPDGLVVFASIPLFFPSVSFFASPFSEGSFLTTLLTSPNAVRFLPKVLLLGAVVERLVARAFLGGSPVAVVSMAAALARVTRVVPTFSAFSSVTARRGAVLAWEVLAKQWHETRCYQAMTAT